MKKLEEAGYSLNLKKSEFFKKRSRMDWTQNRPKRKTTSTRQFGSDNGNRNTKKQKRNKVLPGSNTIPVKVYRKSVNTNRYAKITAKKKQNKWI